MPYLSMPEFLKTLWRASENVYYKHGRIWLLCRNKKSLVLIGDYDGWRGHYSARCQCTKDINRLFLVKTKHKKVIQRHKYCADAAMASFELFQSFGGIKELIKNNLMRAFSYTNHKKYIDIDAGKS
jgi:hypothetical protein